MGLTCDTVLQDDDDDDFFGGGKRKGKGKRGGAQSSPFQPGWFGPQMGRCFGIVRASVNSIDAVSSLVADVDVREILNRGSATALATLSSWLLEQLAAHGSPAFLPPLDPAKVSQHSIGISPTVILYSQYPTNPSIQDLRVTDLSFADSCAEYSKLLARSSGSKCNTCPRKSVRR